MLLTVNALQKSYVNASGKERKVLQNLSFELEAGRTAAIVGSSGTGKSTFLNMLGLMDNADDGEVLFDGKRIFEFSEKERRVFRNKALGFVFQQHHLLPQCSVMENALLPTLAFGKAEDGMERAQHLLKRLGLWELKDQKPGELSVGECQRVAIARALINKPALLLADEPSGALDQQNAAQLAELLLALNQEEQMAVVMVTHDLQLAEKMEHVYRLQDGQLHKTK